MKKNNKILVIITLSFFAVLVFLFLLRSSIVDFILQNKVNDFQNRFGLKIQISGTSVYGVRTLHFTRVNVKHNNDSTLFDAHNIRIKLGLFELVRFKINPLFVGFDSLGVNIFNDVIDNVSAENFIDTIAEGHRQKNVRLLNIKVVSRIFRSLLGFTTSHFDFNNFTINYFGSNDCISISTNHIRSVNGNFNARFNVTENGNQSFFNIRGSSSKDNNWISLKILGDEDQPFQLPFSQPLLGFYLSFDSLSASIKTNLIESDSIHLFGKARVNNLKLFHSQLSESDVVIDSSSFSYGIGLSNSLFAFDSNSTVKLNSFSLPFILRVENRRKPRIQLFTHTGKTPASNLFGSLPKGLFQTLQGIKVRGDIDFELDADINLGKPDSLKFFAKMTPYNFSIISYGNVDFSLLNDSITHTVYVNDSVNKNICLIPENQFYRPIERISPHLKNAILTAEDGGFYSHKGFDPEGFRYALIQNIKQRRMARGGSTITMQLVKNIYLNQSKNLVRKADEALIVWLIETQQIVSKDRILEIYLNIIEWGPCVNGAAEAAKFYFDMDPLELELNEAIFLASIVPKPNLFMQNFDAEGNLREFMTDYYNFIAGKMYERGQITEEEKESLIPNVRLKGKALELIQNRLSNQLADSLAFENTDIQ